MVHFRMICRNNATKEHETGITLEAGLSINSLITSANFCITYNLSALAQQKSA